MDACLFQSVDDWRSRRKPSRFSSSVHDRNENVTRLDNRLSTSLTGRNNTSKCLSVKSVGSFSIFNQLESQCFECHVLRVINKSTGFENDGLRSIRSNQIGLMLHLFDIGCVSLKIGINKLLAALSHLGLSSSIGGERCCCFLHSVDALIEPGIKRHGKTTERERKTWTLAWEMCQFYRSLDHWMKMNRNVKTTILLHVLWTSSTMAVSPIDCLDLGQSDERMSASIKSIGMLSLAMITNWMA